MLAALHARVRTEASFTSNTLSMIGLIAPLSSSGQTWLQQLRFDLLFEFDFARTKRRTCDREASLHHAQQIGLAFDTALCGNNGQAAAHSE